MKHHKFVHSAYFDPSVPVPLPGTMLTKNYRIAARRGLAGWDWGGMLQTAANIGMTNLQTRKAEAEAALARAQAEQIAAQQAQRVPDSALKLPKSLPVIIGAAGLALIAIMYLKK